MSDDWTAKTSMRSTACPPPPPRQPDEPVGVEVPAWLLAAALAAVGIDLAVVFGAIAMHL